MLAYASNTGTRRNLAALKAHDWRILLTPDNPTPRDGNYAIDNGAWKAFQQNQPFDESRFQRLVDKSGGAADFVVVPDIVAGGMKSLAFSLSWLPRLRHLKQCLLPLQDDMNPADVGCVLDAWPGVGLFLGGSTEYKLKNLYAWGIVAAERRIWYHVGRVNTVRRIRLCAEAGATSFDGTSATKYSCNLPTLENGRRQPNLLIPQHQMTF